MPIYLFEQRYNNVGGITNFRTIFLLGCRYFPIFAYEKLTITENNKNTFII